MGVLRFTSNPPSVLAEHVKQAFFHGPDQIPWPADIRIEDSQLVCRPQTDSGSLQIPWPVNGFGTPMLCTGTLAGNRPSPYRLPLELARGKLNQVRNQLASWQSAGLSIDPSFRDRLLSAQRLLHQAATSPDEGAAAALAEQSLAAALDAADHLVQRYVGLSLASRHRQYPKLGTMWGCHLGDGAPDPAWDQIIPAAFNTVCVPMNWRRIEPVEGQYDWEVYDQQIDWAARHQLVVRGGPLILLDTAGLPDWLWLWEKDAGNLLSCMSDFVETAVSRYQSRIRIWEVTARTNTATVLSLDEEQCLRMTVQMLDVARQVDPEAMFLVRLDQPWGEYVADGEHDLSPLHFADTLLRADLGLTAVDLEINFGYSVPGGWPRGLLEFSRLLDLWTCLGVPLHLTLSVPSNETSDPQSGGTAEPLKGAWRRSWDESAQREWVESYLPLVLAKPMVHAVTWCHLDDRTPHELPHSGLLGAGGTPKPAMNALAQLRREHLK